MLITSFVVASARRVFCCSDLPGHNFTITWGIVLSSLRFGFVRDDPNSRAACTLVDHRLQIRAARVFRAVGIVDAVVELSVYRLEGNFLRYARSGDSPRLLPQRGLVPSRVFAVVRAHIERAVDDDRPYPCERAIGLAVFAQRRDMQIVGLGDAFKFFFQPCRHFRILFLETSGEQQSLYGATLIHRAVSLRNLVQWQRQVKHLAGFDFSIPHLPDKVRQEAAHRRWTAMKMDVRVEQHLAVQLNSMWDADITHRTAFTYGVDCLQH